MKRFGLIGKRLTHSYSKDFFNNIFSKCNLKKHEYNNYEITNLKLIKKLIETNNLYGLNVTIPFKQDIIKYLNEIDEIAKEVGSVNTLKIQKDQIKGYNTDIIGFEKSILPLIGKRRSALILGDGGSSKGVQFVLKKNNIRFSVVSRRGIKNYSNLKISDITNNLIIINTTPLGMSPDYSSSPKIPYEYLNKDHLVYDLIYNPKETLFLKKARKQNCVIKNGLEMLHLQAKESWKIWNI